MTDIVGKQFNFEFLDDDEEDDIDTIEGPIQLDFQIYSGIDMSDVSLQENSEIELITNHVKNLDVSNEKKSQNESKDELKDGSEKDPKISPQNANVTSSSSSQATKNIAPNARGLALRARLWHHLNGKFFWNYEIPFINFNKMNGKFDIRNDLSDEWIFVKQLLSYSRNFDRECVIDVQDIEGDFILIDCAQHLPSWLDPDNAIYRCYIHQGKYHIIPEEHSVDDPVEGVALVKDPNVDTVASNEIQDEILKNIERREEDKQIHHTRVVLPLSIAKLLRADPRLMSFAFGVFVEVEEMQTISNRFVDTDSEELNDAIEMNPMMTRCMFAEFYLREGLMPLIPAFDNGSQAEKEENKGKDGSEAPRSKSTNNRTLNKNQKVHFATLGDDDEEYEDDDEEDEDNVLKEADAWEIGKRITVAFDTLYKNNPTVKHWSVQKFKKLMKGSDFGNDPSYASFVQELKKLNYELDESESKRLYIIMKYELYNDTISVADYIDELLSNDTRNVEEFKKDLPTLVPDDSIEWMAEALGDINAPSWGIGLSEEEMADRIASHLFGGMNTMFQGLSDYSGIEVDQAMFRNLLNSSETNFGGNGGPTFEFDEDDFGEDDDEIESNSQDEEKTWKKMEKELLQHPSFGAEVQERQDPSYIMQQLLLSQKAERQSGNIGPLSTMLSSMGIQLPEDEDEEEDFYDFEKEERL